MTLSKHKFVIQKIKNNQRQTDKPAQFRPLPQLYLELLQNKNEVIKHSTSITQDRFNFDNKQNYMDDSRSEYSDYSRSDKSDRSERSDDRSDDRSQYSDDYSDERSEYSNSSQSSLDSQDSNLSDRLIHLLKDDGGNEDRRMDDFNDVEEQPYEDNYRPPTLQELETRGDIDTTTFIPSTQKTQQEIEEEEDKKRELLFKFELLKKSYKGANIPDLSVHTDYKTITRTYEDTVKRLNIDSNVESYKTYLIGGFMAVEYGLGHFLKFDMKGFTQQQMSNMNKYNKLLIELGEKTYVPKGKQWPVEVRLAFLILFNAAIFVISKMILKGTGNNLLNMFNNMGDNTTTSPVKKKKMKGPNVEVEDLPEI